MNRLLVIGMLGAVLSAAACSDPKPILAGVVVKPAAPRVLDYEVTGDLTKRLVLDVEIDENYANLSVYADNKLLVDNLNVPAAGRQVLSCLVGFEERGDTRLEIRANNSIVALHSLALEAVEGLDIPQYRDISIESGLDKVSSIKYGGPTIADIDGDGDYDFIVNNHNAESSKLYWNNGDGTVTRHDRNLARWFMHDLHGTAAGDFDNDGDLDIVVTQGGGNGTNPSKANFYRNDDGTLVLMTGDVGIDRGGRGRGAKWSDMDLDGDLDLMLVNETSLSGDKPQHFFFENTGDGTFRFRSVAGLQDQHPSRALVTDINSDNIDDVILFGPLSVWQGNGDFTFTDVTSRFPADIAALDGIMAIADLDIDNDGDLDLYLARGKEFELGRGEAPSVDHDPLTREFSIKPRGFKGIDRFDFSADGALRFHDYYSLAQGAFRGSDYPIFLGSDKSALNIKSGEDTVIEPDGAQGWPEEISENGMYFGYLGDGRWKAALVRNDDIFWGFRFSLSGVTDVSPEFVPENRNIPDVLLRNDDGIFTDVSEAWNVQPGGNSLGVTVGDFNNDSHEDIFVYRWGSIASRISDYMLLNDGNGSFHTVTMHGASDVGGPGNGDMGQAFDFDLDGDLELLSGSEGGEWYLYENEQPGQGNYALVRVGYSPNSNIDPISAEVIVKTAAGAFRKRVGSVGAVFSQSLLSIVHFGLGEEDVLESVTVRWRNGETVSFKDKPANVLLDTDKLDPETVSVVPAIVEIRKGTSFALDGTVTPVKVNDELTWSSGDDSVATVDERGVVVATGNVGDTTTIMATSPANGLSASSQVTVVEWFALPVESVRLSPTSIEMVAGQSIEIDATVLPRHADDTGLVWSSSDKSVASVGPNGVVTALAAGSATIGATSKADGTVRGDVRVQVESLVEPFIRIVNAELFETGALRAGDSITLIVEYHAGTGNSVISSDEGGIRFWLRHFRSKWFPVRDIVFTDAGALGTESGRSTMTIPLDGLAPTSELPDGHFYLLRASFASSDGNMYEATIYPVNIIESAAQNRTGSVN